MNAFANRPKALPTIFVAGVAAGTLDALGAILIYVVLPGKSSVLPIFQFIASGAAGPRAFNGGVPMAFYGLFWHFMIAFIFAAFYYLLATRIRFLISQPTICGIAYGAFVWLVMNFVVVPLSATPKSPFSVTLSVILVFIWHLFFVGLPIALITARRFLGKS
ncbi:hypothetical protein WBJ53_23210 [Spirosoma sp. SC4-14]|uniref:hypothetical protein n=1 Tax=Spirosoma sp. SC4-14 TaxID=3128900 RepID=UPI0030D0579C